MARDERYHHGRFAGPRCPRPRAGRQVSRIARFPTNGRAGPTGGGVDGSSGCSDEGVRRFPLAPITVALAWVVFSACSASPAHPPELGVCEVNDAGCPAATVSGASGGAEDGGSSSSACSVAAGDAQCTQCADANCCTTFGACMENTDCWNLLNCEQSCSGAAGCVGSCVAQSADGVTLLDQFTSCLETRCPVCSQLGTGDPCSSAGVACNPGLSCSGLWCTKACVHSTDCVGLGAGGGNALGLQNACIATPTAGEECFPGCASDSDCSAIPGAFCFATTSSDGLSVRVCTAPLDAGAD